MPTTQFVYVELDPEKLAENEQWIFSKENMILLNQVTVMRLRIHMGSLATLQVFERVS